MSSAIPPRKRPVRLRPDNFTPTARTPWGGNRITAKYKDALTPEQPVGESWELSVEPDFPSRTHEGEPLHALLARAPAWLGAHAALGSTPLLVKLLDAAAPLSLQIHPRDDDPALGPDESGKPEAWYVLDADPDAALHLGFLPGVDAREVRRCIAASEALDERMRRVPVAPGDYFVIEPGTPHAIGPGLTLVEPQRVLPGRRGLTYRYWDWNRRYDAEGKRDDADGQPRELHLERALAVTDWSGESADLDRIRVRRGPPPTDAGIEPLSHPNATLDVARLAGTGRVELASADTLTALTVVGGEVTLEWDEGTLALRRGETAALPAGLALRARLERTHALRCGVRA